MHPAAVWKLHFDWINVDLDSGMGCGHSFRSWHRARESYYTDMFNLPNMEHVTDMYSAKHVVDYSWTFSHRRPKLSVASVYWTYTDYTELDWAYTNPVYSYTGATLAPLQCMPSVYTNWHWHWVWDSNIRFTFPLKVMPLDETFGVSNMKRVMG